MRKDGQRCQGKVAHMGLRLLTHNAPVVPRVNLRIKSRPSSRRMVGSLANEWGTQLFSELGPKLGAVLSGACSEARIWSGYPKSSINLSLEMEILLCWCSMKQHSVSGALTKLLHSQAHPVRRFALGIDVRDM